MRVCRAAILIFLALGGGCGTTKWSDTSRTATEQLLLSDSMDRAVSRIDFRALAAKRVFLDDTAVKPTTDSGYLCSCIRQHIMASGGILRDKREEADYIVELRAGAIGTDRHELLFGVPALTIPTIAPMPGVPSQIPEIPLVKRTDQRGVAKISLFIYNRNTGRIVWQSGMVPEESRAKAVWVFGAGPFQRGSIYRGTKFAGDHFSIPLIDLDKSREGQNSTVSVAEEAFFVEPKEKEKPAETKEKKEMAKAPTKETAEEATKEPIKGAAKDTAKQETAKGEKPIGPQSSPQQHPPGVVQGPPVNPALGVVQAGLTAPAGPPPSAPPTDSGPTDPFRRLPPVASETERSDDRLFMDPFPNFLR